MAYHSHTVCPTVSTVPPPLLIPPCRLTPPPPACPPTALPPAQDGPHPRSWFLEHPAVAKMGISGLWAAAWAADAVARLLTWQNKALSKMLAYGLCAALVASLIIPAWVFLASGVLGAFCMTGPLLKYPVLHTYLWPSHVTAVLRRRALEVQPYVRRLRVTVHKAHSIVTTDVTSDLVYVTVFVRDQVRRTKTVTQPFEWEKELEFIVFSPHCHVTLWLAEHDLGNRDDFTGEAILQTDGVATTGGQEWINLTQRSCRPDDYAKLVGGRLLVSWKLEKMDA